MVPVPFGFSVGDFVASISICAKVITALRDTKGAETRLYFTILQLQKLKRILSTIDELQTNPISVDVQLIEEARFLGTQCRQPLDRFLEDLNILESRICVWQRPNDAGISDKAHAALARIKWAMRVKRHVQSFYESVSPQLDLIDVLLGLINLQWQTKNHESIEDLNKTLENIQQLHSG
ncbi:hypothetical protein BDV96DRAFT_579856 [Lophiotrema nucula]|uniref:Fungal N-terminal domain-containing protein n=1 Tax=Lophiotrema nucula TaxID=690887 RepID=A0A6A5Z075_9PLEO|nr:hypothetical protein BDV96DRAFT_579856 [Lophiotrema nucula]